MEYDAFVVCNDEGEDKEFVDTISKFLENEPNNFKLFIPGRSDEGQNLSLSELAELVEKRCRKYIIIISSNFFRSQTAVHYLNLIHKLKLESMLQGSSPMVPIYLENCKKPASIRNMSSLHYYETDIRPWFWQRLTRALCTKNLVTRDSKVQQDTTAPDIVLSCTR